MTSIENRTFDEINTGDSAQLERTLTKKDVEIFAIMSGDINPAHVDEEYAKSDLFHKIIAHGMWGGALISTVLGTDLPGPGTIYLSQNLKFKHPIGLGDHIRVIVTVLQKDPATHHITLDCKVINQKDEIVIEGEALVLAPMEKIKRPIVELPQLVLQDPKK